MASSAVIDEVLEARHWTELGDPDTATYRKFTRQVHPDVNQDPRALSAFQHLTLLWQGKDTAPKMNVTLVAEQGFELQRTASGQFLYTVSSKADNDLIVRAENAYTKLSDSKDPQFFPALEGKRHSAEGRSALQLGIPDGNWWLLSDFPELGGRDVVWIAKRVLVALINAHSVDAIHGNITAYDIYINPSEHGVLLGGWGASVGRGEKLVLRPHHPCLLDRKVGSGWLDRRAVSKVFSAFNLKEKPLRDFFNTLYNEHTTTRHSLVKLTAAADAAFGTPKFNDLKEPTHIKDLRNRF